MYHVNISCFWPLLFFMLQWSWGEANSQPAVPVWEEQAVQRRQPRLQWQQRHDHRAQHGWVSGQPDQSSQWRSRRLPRPARERPAEPHYLLSRHQWRAQLSHHPWLTPTHPPGTIRPKYVNTYVPICSCSLLTCWSVLRRLINNHIQMSLAAIWLTRLYWPKECPK